MWALADRLTLTRDDLAELAEVILWRDVASLKDLDDAQVARMLDALEGAEKVFTILRDRA